VLACLKGERVKTLLCIALAAAVACQITGVAAAEGVSGPGPGPTASPQPRRIGQVIVTAARHRTLLDDTPRDVWTISGADVIRLGAATAADALRFIPGILVAQYGAYGSLATVALRGASSEQTLVLINGQPANEGDTGVFDFSSLPATLIARIEVVEGGASTLYGSAAVGGVINIITKQAVSGGNLNLFGQWGYQGAFTRGFGLTFGPPNLLTRVDAQTASAANVFAYPAYDGFYPAGVRTNDDVKTEDTAVNVNAHLGSVAAELMLQNDAEDLGAPGSASAPSGLARQIRIYQRAQADFDLPLGDGDVDVAFGSSGRRLHFYDPTPPFPYDTQGNATSRSAAVRATFGAGRGNVVTAGYDVRADVALFDYAFTGLPRTGPPVACEGLPVSHPCVARDARDAVYLQDELAPPDSRLVIWAGVRRETASNAPPLNVPGAGAVVHLSQALDATLNYGRSFRSPNLDELYYPGYGNVHLSPEYAAAFDAGLREHGAASNATLAYFGQDTQNLIINRPIDAFGDVEPFNVSRARVRGLESSLQSNVGHDGHAALTYTAYLRAVDLTPQFAGNRLLYRPTSTASLEAWVDRGRWSYGLQSVFVGRRFADEANAELLRPYVITGVHVRRRINRSLALTVRLDNLENNHNAEDVLGYPVLGRRLTLRLATRE
jgi:vitamin B12 transporter